MTRRACGSRKRCVVLHMMATIVSIACASTTADGGGFDRAISTVLPRVVKLYGLGAGRQAGFGSGILVSPDGLVLTVSSLLIDGRNIRAVTDDGTAYEAHVLHRDDIRQLALLQLETASASDPGRGSDRPNGRALHQRGETRAAHGAPGKPFPYFDLSREVSLAPGDWIVAAGNAFQVAEGAEQVSLAHGVYSTTTRLDARRRMKDYPYRGDVLVIDAITSNPGAPGSAVVDLQGAFVGMVGRVVLSNRTHTQFNYAVPREVLYDFLQEALADSDRFQAASTVPAGDAPDNVIAAGPSESAADVRSESNPPERSTAMTRRDAAKRTFDPGIRISRVGYRKVLPFVERVQSGSPADRAGVRAGDLVLAVNGRTIADADEYRNRIALLRADDSVDLVIRRGKKILTMHIEPAKEAP